MKIAVIETSYIGDIAFLFPFFKAIKRIFPESELTLITRPIQAEAIKIIPYIDHVILFDKKNKYRGLKIINFRKETKDKKFDILFAPHRYGTTKIISKVFLDASSKISYQFLGCHLIFDGCEKYRSDLPVELRATQLLNKFNKEITEKDLILNASEVFLGEIEKKYRLKGRDFVFLLPGSEWETKRWLPEYYGIIAKWIEETGFEVFTGGSPSEKKILETLREFSRGSVQLFENTSLSDMLGIMYFSKLIIGGDTGPVHLMRILGKNVIQIFGPTPHDIFIWRENQIPLRAKGLKCSPCHHHGPRHCPMGDLACQFEVKPEEVWDKFLWFQEKFF